MNQQARRIRILAVDDHPALRFGIAAMLETDSRFEMAGCVESAEAAVQAFVQLRPDVTLMDLQMPGMGGIEGIKTMRARWPAARIIVLTTYRGDFNARTALQAGAAGYLLKSALRSELMDGIVRVHAGGRYVCAEIGSDIAETVGTEPLTAKERQVLELVSDGLGNKQIACSLGISRETVKSHMCSLLDKLGVTTRSGAIRIGLRRGILSSPNLQPD